MEIRYATNKLAKQFSNATEIKKAFGMMAPKVSQRIDEIDSADNLAILKQIPAAKCHELEGNRKGEWAVHISKNHRIIFEPDHDPIPRGDKGEVDTVLVTDIVITKAEDYH